MKTKWYFFSLVFSGFPLAAFSQYPCDQLQIDDIRFFPFNKDILGVKILNSGDYDNFPEQRLILRDTDGDTLAQTSGSDFFGIEWHTQIETLLRHPDAGPLQEIVGGTLELWTWDYDSLACIFPITETFCPRTTCNMFEIFVGGYAMPYGTSPDKISYAIHNEAGSLLVYDSVYNGQWPPHFDSICLYNGNYTLSMTHNKGGQGTVATFGFRDQSSPFQDWNIDGFSQGFSGLTFTTTFSVFENCSPRISPPEPEAPVVEEPVEVVPNPAGIWVFSKNGDIREVFLHDLSGRLFSRKPGDSESLFIPTGNWSGILLVRVFLENGKHSAHLAYVNQF